jgi:hypothetical protein
MNTSFNVITSSVNAEEIVSKINALNVKTAIVNGIETNHSTYGMIQMVTLLDCDRKTFNKIKNRVAVKSYFRDGFAY